MQALLSYDELYFTTTKYVVGIKDKLVGYLNLDQ